MGVPLAFLTHFVHPDETGLRTAARLGQLAQEEFGVGLSTSFRCLAANRPSERDCTYTPYLKEARLRQAIEFDITGMFFDDKVDREFRL